MVFELAGAESIPLDDATVDVVFMFKSLHHVPVDRMGQAMQEIRRVLKPGGKAYISEPVYAGAFNDILRLFHDEQAVREAAFDVVRQAVEEGAFVLVEELFFNSPMAFDSFEDFDTRVLKVTHTDHALDETTYRQVRERFQAQAAENGSALFLMPIRVDLLAKAED